MDLTMAQKDMLQYLKNAYSHYRLLLYLISSASFKKYFNMLSLPNGQSVLLPMQGYNDVYISYGNRTFELAEEEADDVEELEDEEAAGVSYAS
jgi:hypothetical protein